MRNRTMGRIAALSAAIAATMSAAPAMACYGGCSQGFNFGPIDSSGYATVDYGHSRRAHLTNPTGPRSFVGPQYYYVNQGPYYTGPGLLAPSPTYQERAVGGWYSTSQPYYYGYDGGPYANATNHLYDGAYVGAPVVYSYRGHRRHGSLRSGSRSYGPRYHNAPRSGVRYGYAGPRTQGERMRIY